MSQLAAIQIPKPSDEQAFERAANELFRCILRDPNVTLHGRRGQAQFGVDNSGIRDSNPHHVVGIQCKLKGDGKGLTEKEVRQEVVKAREFKPLLSEYIIVTTEPDHTLHSELALTLSQEESQGRTKPLRVAIWGWDTLEREILQYPAARNAFDPTHTAHGDLLLDEFRQLKERFDELPQVRAPSSVIAGEIKTGSEDDNPLHAHLDKQITQYAELLKSAPSAALDLLAKLQDDLDETATPRLRYRVAANIAACHLELGDELKSGEQLVSSYAIDPSHEKAASNKALGLLLLGQKEEACKFAGEKIKKQPENGSLACYLIQARIGDESITDPMEGIPPELATDPEVEVALVKYASDVGPPGHWRELSVEAYGRHPDVPEVELNYAIALLDEAIETTQLKYGHVLSAVQISNLEKVIDILTPRWEAIKDPAKHVRGDLLSAPLNLMTAYRLLHRAEDAQKVGLDAHRLFSDNDEVKERLGAVYMELGERDAARSIVSEIPVTPASFMIRFTAAIETKDWPAIDYLYENHLQDCPTSERSLIDAGYLIAKLSRSSRETVEADLERAEDTFKTEPRALVALSQFCRFEGHGDQSLKFYELAKASFDIGSFGLADRMMFANEAMNRDQAADAASVLYGHVDLTRDSAELQLLAEALACEYPPRERGVEFFESLSAPLFRDSRYQVFNAVRCMNSGLTGDAVPLLKSAFDADSKLSTLTYLFQALFRMGWRDGIAEYLENRELDDLAGRAGHKISYAQVLLEFGQWDRAIQIGYQTVSIAYDDPSVVMKFCGLVLKPSEAREVRFDGLVGAGAWVRLTSDQGETYERIIGEKTDKPWGDAVALDNAFIRNAVGLKTGDTFTADGGFGMTKTWTVSEVKPVWLHAFHVLSSTFTERFPGVAGFATFQMKDNDIQPTLDQIKKWSEGVRAQANLYLVDGIPACLVARNRTGGAIALADYLVSIGESFRTCAGSFDERELALSTIKEHEKGGAILDAFTAWRIAELDAFEIVKEINRIGIWFVSLRCRLLTRSILQDIKKLHEIESKPLPDEVLKALGR